MMMPRATRTIACLRLALPALGVLQRREQHFVDHLDDLGHVLVGESGLTPSAPSPNAMEQHVAA